MINKYGGLAMTEWTVCTSRAAAPLYRRLRRLRGGCAASVLAQWEHSGKKNYGVYLVFGTSILLASTSRWIVGNCS